MRKGPLTVKNLRIMVTKFEETESLNVRSGRGRKPVSAEAIEEVALQELLPHDFETRHLFSLLFLARLEVDSEWPWNILWTDDVPFHLDEERVISRQIRHLWPPRSPDLNPFDFWLWGHLKQLLSCDQPRTLPDLKDSISRHVLNISQNTLRLTVEHAMLRFQIVAENDGHHVEHL
ncbi:uncharacterized protein TNCV_112071 [Trichonephila clavipes]|nr:uncharacterized protein TNCV_112071 [Trichonephila clavipes]